ncbi:MAG: hypothetical protein F6K41_03055 [Symploca sp. SIO3E6]|nr:hypothetical protein [Caldora sp. SIO3E6]
MDFDKLINCLSEKGILKELDGKRMTTNEMPSLLYLRLIIAGLATNKSRTNCMMTALETYTMRNAEKHLSECKLKAKIDGMELEEWLCDRISKQLGGE